MVVGQKRNVEANMARSRTPKGKLVRKFAENIFGTKQLDKVLARKPHPAGAHGKKMHRRLSDYGTQLKEKQKLKSIYGILEKQFRRYYNTARKERAATGTKLLQILESRLDNLVFRAGFAKTRPAARQMVGHGNVLVDNKKLSIPSFLVKPGQIITLSAKAQKNPQVVELLQKKDHQLPKYIKRKAIVAKYDRVPERDEIDIIIQEQLIVEFYSR
jgi:small subunit ribosomal protein S4